MDLTILIPLGRKIFQNLTDIKKAVADCHSSFAEQNDCKFSVLKEMLMKIELAFSEYREHEQEKMEELAKLESTLWQECSILAEKISVLEHSSPQQLPQGVIRPCHPPVKLALADSVLPEVAAFQEYLTNSGGRTGGWKDFSHQTFLKIRRRYVRQNSTTSDEKSD
uniref:Hepatoma-derived growth factor-related protein 2 n=1 Tax=Mesocestoides corti TaxID=53468 RepID=A0A5K3FQD6_MESCO